MSDVKINNKYICGDDEFKVTTGDKDSPSEYYSITHNAVDTAVEVGLGSQVDNLEAPVVINDDAYVDLPANSAGFGTIQEYGYNVYARFSWDTSNNIILIENTTNVDDADTDGYLCIFDNTSSVRIRNRLGEPGRFVIKYNYSETLVAPTFKAFSVPSGVDNLDPNLTINGTTVTPTFRYKGGDASASGWTAWDYGSTLSKIAGSPTYNNGSPGLGSNDDSIFFAADTYYQGSGDTGYITTEDFVIELVFQYSTETNDYLIGNWNSVTSVGWLLYTPSAGSFRLFLDDTSGTISVTASGLTDGAWYHLIAFGNRDENSTSGCSIFLNGVSSATGNISTMSGSLAGSDLTIGAAANGVNFYNYRLAFAALWKQSSWHKSGASGPAEWADVAAERFAKFCGYFPQVYTGYNLIVDGDMETAGTAAWTASNSTLAKDSTSPLYEGTQHLRITSTTNSFWATQTVLSTGARYRVTGAARMVSGSVSPGIYSGGTIWSGAPSTSWQEFDFEFDASTTSIWFGSPSSHPGVVDFDNVSVTRVNWIPETNTRAYAAYLDKVEGDYRKLYYVGSEWLRMCHRVDANATSIRGYLSEQQTENLSTYFEDFSFWTKFIPGDVLTDDVIAGPDGETKAASYASSTDDTTHFIYRAMTHPAATTMTASIYAKAGAKDWVFIYIATIGYCFYDVKNGVVGTPTDAVGYIEGPFYNGFYRCILVYTGDGASHGFRVYPAESGTNYTFAGDGVTVDTYFWGGQVEVGDYATSPVKTVGAALTRLKDQLRFVAGDNIGGEDLGQGTIALDFLLETHDTGVSKYLAAVSDGGSSTDLYALRVTNADIVGGLTRASGGNNGDADSTGDYSNGVIHSARLTYETDNVNLYTDGNLDATDLIATMPNDMDRLMLGSSYAETLQLNGIVSQVRIYAVLTTKG